MTCAVLSSFREDIKHGKDEYRIFNFLYKFVFKWLKTYFPQAEIVNPEGVHSTVPGLIIQIQNQE